VDFSTLFIAPLIAEFTRLYPLIHFDLRLTEQWIDLVEQGADITIRLGLQADSALTIHHLGEIHYGLYASPEYLRRSGRMPVEPSELTQHSCIRMVCPHWDETWTLMDAHGASARVKVEQNFSANNVGSVRRLATLGLRIAPLDHLLAREDIDAGLLRPVLPNWRFSPVPIYALTPTKTIPAKTRIFLKFLVNRRRNKAPETLTKNGPQAPKREAGVPNSRTRGGNSIPPG
jgi:DNA-binding transcriptional LysR family regulator